MRWTFFGQATWLTDEEGDRPETGTPTVGEVFSEEVEPVEASTARQCRWDGYARQEGQSHGEWAGQESEQFQQIDQDQCGNGCCDSWPGSILMSRKMRAALVTQWKMTWPEKGFQSAAIRCDASRTANRFTQGWLYRSDWVHQIVNFVNIIDYLWYLYFELT